MLLSVRLKISKSLTISPSSEFSIRLHMLIIHFCFFVPSPHSQQLEWQTLSMVRGLSAQLRSACSSVVSSAQGLPGTVQDQLTSARQAAEELQSSLGNTSTITPLLLERSRQQLKQVQCALYFLYCSVLLLLHQLC